MLASEFASLGEVRRSSIRVNQITEVEHASRFGQNDKRDAGLTLRFDQQLITFTQIEKITDSLGQCDLSSGLYFHLRHNTLTSLHSLHLPPTAVHTCAGSV